MLKKPIWNTLVQILGKGITVLISLLTTGIITRKLGVDNYGYFILVTSTFVLLDALSDFGIRTIGIRELSKGKKVLGKILQLKTIMTAIAWILGMGMIWMWSGFEGIRVEATISLLMVWLTSAFGIGDILFQSKLMMQKKVLMDVLFPLFFLMVIVSWQGEINLMWVFVVYLIARLVSMIPGWLMIKNFKEIKELNPPSLDRAGRARLLKLWDQTWPMGVYMILFAAYDRVMDSVLIQHYLGSREVAFYGLAYKIYAVMIQPAYFYVNSIFPIMSSKKKGKRNLFKISLVLLTLGMIGIIIMTMILAPWMVKVLAGLDYAPAATVLKILVWGCAFSYFGHLVGFTLIARGGQKEMLKVGIVGLIFNVVLNIILIPHWGIYGAAGITVATEAIDLVIMSWYLWKREKF
jgi:O-antigen/teichoic acid export membrane protein